MIIFIFLSVSYILVYVYIYGFILDLLQQHHKVNIIIFIFLPGSTYTGLPARSAWTTTPRWSTAPAPPAPPTSSRS